MSTNRKRSLNDDSSDSGIVKSPRLSYKIKPVNRRLLARPPREILASVAPQTKIGVCRTDFWNPKTQFSSKCLTIWSGTALFSDETIACFNYGKKRTENALCAKVLRQFNLLDTMYGDGFTKKNIKSDELHPKVWEFSFKGKLSYFSILGFHWTNGRNGKFTPLYIRHII